MPKVYARHTVLCLAGISSACSVIQPYVPAAAPSVQADPVTVSGYTDLSRRKTQFFEDDHNKVFWIGDMRVEYWVDHERDRIKWGPYARLAWVESGGPEPWENVSWAGVGLQLYPFSAPRYRQEDSTVGRLLGPLRAYGEFNYAAYEDDWRPDDQVRAGLDYWKASHVNDTSTFGWFETWNGAWFQSTNEFDDDYDTFLLADVVRGGIWINSDASWGLSPYVSVESVLSENDTYYWENRLTVGGGLRLAPNWPSWFSDGGINRLFFYVEYLEAVDYYGASPPSSVPDSDIRFGIELSIGQWYH